MKRIYRKRKSKKLREDTLEQLQKTRAQFEEKYPELLVKARKALGADAPAADEEKDTSKQSRDGGDEAIDRKKTLEVILKYAATQTGGQKDNLKKELKKFLN